MGYAPTILGYARVSTDDQTTALQHDALRKAGCERIFEDVGVSGVAKKRPGLERALLALNAGDVLTVWKLDRLGRSLPDLLRIVEDIKARGAHLRSLTEHLDTTTSAGTLIFQVMGALAQYERSLIIERTQAGMRAAKARGKKLGRRRALTSQQVQQALQLMAAKNSVSDVCRTFGIGRSTLYRDIKRLQEAEATRPAR